MNESFIHFTGWSAYANAALVIAIFVTIALYFAIGGFWGTLNDAISVVWALTFVPLLFVLYYLNKPVNPPLNLALVIAGIAAMSAFAFLQSLLVLGLVRFEQTFMVVVTLGGILGLVLLLNGVQARASQSLPAGLAWLIIIFGLGYILSAGGIWLGGQQHPLAAGGYLVSVLAGPAWAIWLGRLLLNGRLLPTANLVLGGSS